MERHYGSICCQQGIHISPTIRPLCIEVNDGAVLCGEVQHLLPVGVGYAAVGRGAPSCEDVACAGEGVGGEGLGGAVGEVLIAHRARGGIVVLIEADGVGGPAEGVVGAGVGAGEKDALPSVPS